MIVIKSEKWLSKIVLVGLSAVTLIVFSQGVTDPVNVTKLFILGGFSFSAIAVLSFRDWQLNFSRYPIFMILALFFLVASFSTLLFSSAPISQTIYGSYGRNNGFLLYLFLCLLLFSILSGSEPYFFKNILTALYIAGVVNVIYCLWVVFFGDFIGWFNPYGNILGTLGNPNFIGSFLGMFSSLLFSRLFSHDSKLKNRLIDFILLCATLFLIYKSHAIQGRILFVGAFLINFFYFSRSYFKSKLMAILTVSVSLILGCLSILGTLQKGPLSTFLYKDSVSLRGQYWYAGIQMAKNHLFSGVGFDAYGDWYRQVRRSSALVRPGVEVTSNTAHNVFIDLFAFGGLPLLLSYTGLVAMVIVSVIRQTIKRKHFDPVFVGMVGAWLGYLAQSIISINQIGLAIWGWSLAAAIVAYGKCSLQPASEIHLKSNLKKNVKTPNQQIISPNLKSGVGLVIGLIISVPPLSADMKWRSAQLSQDAKKVQESLEPSYMNPVTSYRYVSTVGVFIDNNLPDLALQYTKLAIHFNPRSYESWRLFTFLNNTNPQELELALRKMKSLDPLNPMINPNKPK